MTLNIHTRTPKRRLSRGVSISIADGEFVAIVGHNGSGKSTLAKMLNALAAAVVRQRDCVRNGHGG